MIHSRQITPLVPSADYTSNTNLFVDVNDLGLSRGQVVVGGILLVEVTTNTNTDAVKLGYFGPLVQKSDGTVYNSNRVINDESFTGGSTANDMLILGEGNQNVMYPISGDAGMRLYLSSGSWDGTFTAEINALLLVTD